MNPLDPESPATSPFPGISHAAMLLSPPRDVQPHVDAVWLAARRAATTKTKNVNGRWIESIDYAAITPAARWMWRWIDKHWPRREWLALPPARVAGETLHAWQHSNDNTARYEQGVLL